MSDSLTERRRFLSSGTVAIGGLAVAGTAQAAAARKPVASLRELESGKPVSFNYPGDEPAYVIDLGHPTPGGVGPKKSIVAFSALCQHMGCPVQHDAKSGHFVCPCHASVFAPERGGQAIEGPSTRGLPVVRLALDGDQIHAVGIEGGTVYGRACNKA